MFSSRMQPFLFIPGDLRSSLIQGRFPLRHLFFFSASDHSFSRNNIKQNLYIFYRGNPVKKSIRTIFPSHASRHSCSISAEVNGMHWLRCFNTSTVLYSETDILVPPFPKYVTEGDVMWIKNVGDRIYYNEVVCYVETEKLVLEVRSPGDGIILSRYVDNGQIVKAKQKIFKIKFRANQSGTKKKENLFEVKPILEKVPVPIEEPPLPSESKPQPQTPEPFIENSLQIQRKKRSFEPSEVKIDTKIFPMRNSRNEYKDKLSENLFDIKPILEKVLVPIEEPPLPSKSKPQPQTSEPLSENSLQIQRKNRSFEPSEVKIDPKISPMENSRNEYKDKLSENLFDIKPILEKVLVPIEEPPLPSKSKPQPQTSQPLSENSLQIQRKKRSFEPSEVKIFPMEYFRNEYKVKLTENVFDIKPILEKVLVTIEESPLPSKSKPQPPTFEPLSENSLQIQKKKISVKSSEVKIDRKISLKENSRNEYKVKLTETRKMTAERRKKTQNEAVLLTIFNEVDMSNTIAFRKAHQESLKKKYGINIGFISTFIKAASYALQDQPIVNACIIGNEIVYRDYIDISIAAATPNGLARPVIRDVSFMNFVEIENRIKDLTEKALKGELSDDDIYGGTFSVSNSGVFNSFMGTPIINPQQSATLGINTTVERPMAIKGKVVIRPMMYVAVTYDHRLIENREAALFLRKVIKCVEEPLIMITGI
ncbi:unnamed protein product [Nezara viridula]|uniref:Dihydrolipoamide acetyltransferase component of pyruvate dehydrogenase complex n=1 Tax=Nezara viridula TaxID=85310 RepID=A0A9P0HCG6_NEZVI|nr:unnamed protein product [Nezara viridula]